MKTRKPSKPRESQPVPGRYFHLTYSNAGPDDLPKLFQGRDGAAFDELAAALPPLGYQYGTTIHFYPNDKRPLKEFPALCANDLLVLTTRPPLTDREALSPPRRIIWSSENDLEKLIFKQLFHHISYCTRKNIKLAPAAQERLIADVTKWKSLEFFEHSGPTHPLGVAHIRRYLALPKKLQGGANSTVAFLFRADSLPGVDGTPGLPCALLASFGMDGYSTLIWNTVVRYKFPHLVAQAGFVMAELIFKQPIPGSPLTPEFAADPAFLEVNLLTRTSASS
jgi:hypothetical protein